MTHNGGTNGRVGDTRMGGGSYMDVSDHPSHIPCSDMVTPAITYLFRPADLDALWPRNAQIQSFLGSLGNLGGSE